MSQFLRKRLALCKLDSKSDLFFLLAVAIRDYEDIRERAVKTVI
jgi:hypothetical protein